MIVNARVTFQRSPIHVLEKFTFKDTGRALAEFKNRSGFEECVIVHATGSKCTVLVARLTATKSARHGLSLPE